jgi:hypothetical protein
MTSPRTLARITGALYLLPLAPFSLLYVPSRLVVRGDAAATARNIAASESLFRLGIVSGLLSQVGFVFVVLLLYKLFAHVHRDMAKLMVILLLLGVPIAMGAELGRLAALRLLDRGPSEAFTPEQLHALVSLCLYVYDRGIDIAGLFWGLWLFPLAYLVFKSSFLPRILGIALAIAAMGYSIQSIASMLLPDRGINLVLYTSWGEFFLASWLLLKGVNGERSPTRPREA